MASFLLFLCIAAGCGVIGILFMLYAPTLNAPRQRIAYVGPAFGIAFAPPRAPMLTQTQPYVSAAAEATTPFTPPAQFDATPIVPSLKRAVSTDFTAEEPVREYRLPVVPPPLPPPPTPLPTPMKAAPRLGVSAPARSRHLEPPRRMPPPLPRTRSARGSDAPPIATFSTENQRTVRRDREEFSSGEHTFVD